MACCKCCCGNKDCAQGDQGKCCCGGSSGTCCQEGEYCCDGECQETPCGGACCDPVFGCTQTADEETCTGEGGTWLGLGIPCDPNPCHNCPCEKRSAFDTYAYGPDEAGNYFCCPPGTTVAEDLLCNCEDNDPRCQPGTPWFMAPESSEGWHSCGDFCVPIDEECPA